MNFLAQLAMEAGVVDQTNSDLDMIALMGDNIESLSNESLRVMGMITALQNNYERYITGNDTVSLESYQNYVATTDAILVASGLTLPTEIIAPSFESMSDVSMEAEAKKDNFIVRAAKYLWQKLQDLGKWIKSWWTKSEETIEVEAKKLEELEKSVEELVEAVDKPANPAPAQAEVKAKVETLRKETVKLKVPVSLITGQTLDKKLITDKFLPYVNEVIGLLNAPAATDIAEFKKKHARLIERLKETGTGEANLVMENATEFSKAVSVSYRNTLPKLRSGVKQLQGRIKTLEEAAAKLANSAEASGQKDAGKVNIRKEGVDLKGSRANQVVKSTPVIPGALKAEQERLAAALEQANLAMSAALRLQKLIRDLNAVAVKGLAQYKAKLHSAGVKEAKAA